MESRLPDPLGDRVVKDLSPPPIYPLNHSVLFPERLKSGDMEVPDWQLLRDHLVQEGRLTKPDFHQIIRTAMELMSMIP